MIPPWIWEGHCPLVINIYKTRMPSDTLLTEEKKKAEYIGRQLRISLFAAIGTPHPALRAWNGNVFVAWLQLFSLLQFPLDRLDFSGLSLRSFLILSSSFPTFVYCFACGKNCCSCAQPFILLSPCIANDLQVVIVQTESQFHYYVFHS